MSWLDWISGVFGRRARRDTGMHAHRGPATHIIILDGTMSSLAPGRETNAGLTYSLLAEVGASANTTIYYEAGIQWTDWRGTIDVMTGRGINRQIRRAYGVLASRYRPGDKIVLIGYSRGAYAVRSLAGVIDMVGLLKANNATVSAIRTAYRHYQAGAVSEASQAFRAEFCHAQTQIEAVAVWDTVKALGLRLPVLWRYTNAQHAFHNHHLGPSIQNGFHALAYHERREAYRPVMWDTRTDWEGHIEQVWFKGTHADVGGQIDDVLMARPLANIPLVWMLGRLEACGVQLPADWQSRFPTDARAPSVGAWHGWAKLFWFRRARKVGDDPSERLHPSLAGEPSVNNIAISAEGPNVAGSESVANTDA